LNIETPDFVGSKNLGWNFPFALTFDLEQKALNAES